MTTLLAILLWFNISPTIIPSETIRKVVQEYVSRRWDSSRGDCLIEFRGIPTHITVQAADYSIQVGIGSIPRLKGHLGIAVEIVSRGKIEQRVIVPVHIRTFGNVFAIGRQLGRHDRVSKEDVAINRLETTDLPDDLITSEEELQGRRTIRIVAAHSILCRSMLEPLPVVNQEDLVTVSAHMRKITVTLKGIAKQEGCIGDLITVQRIGSFERFKATVIGEHNVVVDVDPSAIVGRDN